MANNLEMGMRGQFILDAQAERNEEKEALRTKLEMTLQSSSSAVGKLKNYQA